MVDLNVDMMKAKMPIWFTKIVGWESRVLVIHSSRYVFSERFCHYTHTPWAQALKADISLIFGVKPDTKDGTLCLEVR